MRVTFHSFPNALLPRLQNLGSAQNTALDQISSGQRIRVPSDDAAAMGRVLTMRSEKQQQQQFWRNAERALSISQASFATLDRLNSTGARAGELAVLGSDATTPATTLAAYGAELDQLVENAVGVANGKQLGRYLLSGTAADTAPFAVTRNAAGTVTGVTYQGAADDGAAFRISENELLSPCTSESENRAVADFLNNLVALRDALQSGSPAAVGATRPALGTSEDALLAGLARIAGVQYRIEVSTSDANARFQALQQSISKESDLDFAEASIRLTRAQTAYEAALQSAARILSTSLLDYIR